MTFNITPRVHAGGQLIGGYGDGGFTIAGVRHQGSVLVLTDRTVAWPVRHVDLINDNALADLSEELGNAEILVIGCGHVFQPMPSGVAQKIKAQQIGLEWMDTGAACRTFNVLLTEGRRVAAALIAVD
ncbi:MAG: Mth938-like domain-containing protein [Hyphomicrobiales bacterium]|nr:Mth938-like domain-containing protein [Hyphomicrobiales bacterium]